MAGGINPFVYVLNDPVNLIDPLGLLGNPFSNYPSFSSGFPNSNVAAIADIAVGGIEAGAAVVTGTATVITAIAGPEAWLISVPLGGFTAVTAVDAYGRITGGIKVLLWNSKQKPKEEKPCP